MLTVVAHESTCMSGVEDPTKWLGEVISRVNDARNMVKVDVAILFPVLDGEVLYINVASPFSWEPSVDHLDGGNVVRVDRGGRGLTETNFGQDGTEIASHLGGSDGSKELGLSRTGGSDGLSLGSVGNGTTSKYKNKTRGRATVA